MEVQALTRPARPPLKSTSSRSGSRPHCWQVSRRPEVRTLHSWRSPSGGSFPTKSWKVNPSDAYRTIDLHFHDLRHEAGSRWLEQGLPLHHVKELLGHASISTTDTYLNASRIHLRESMLEMEKRGKSDTNVPQNVPPDRARASKRDAKITGKSLLH